MSFARCLTVCIKSTSICQFKFEQCMNNATQTIKHSIFNLQPLRAWLLERLFCIQFDNTFVYLILAKQNIKELTNMFSRALRAYDLRPAIHNCRSHGSLQRFAWCIANLVFKLLKPSLNCCLAERPILGNAFRRKLMDMQNNGFVIPFVNVLVYQIGLQL